MQIISDSGRRDNSQDKTQPVIVGTQRCGTTTWADLILMVRNGAGLVRDGSAVRLINSEAYETVMQ